MEVRRLSVVPYREAWEMQRVLAAERATGDAPDTLVLLEHPDVYTAGRRTEAWERPVDGAAGVDVVDVDRGGKITWHGPGQLVGYPIVLLPQPLDVVAYVRTLEAALIDVCAEFGLEATLVEGRTGVWTADGARKLGAIGVRVRRRVTYHGFALNCCNDLGAYDRIVACGITDAGVTSLSAELGRRIEVAEARPVVEAAMVAHLVGFLDAGNAKAGHTAARNGHVGHGERPAASTSLARNGLELVG